MGYPAPPMGARIMQVCEVIYGCERGRAMVALLETATGQPCPCKQGIPCPLMPRDVAVTLPAPRLVELVEHVPLD